MANRLVLRSSLKHGRAHYTDINLTATKRHNISTTKADFSSKNRTLETVQETEGQSNVKRLDTGKVKVTSL